MLCTVSELLLHYLLQGQIQGEGPGVRTPSFWRNFCVFQAWCMQLLKNGGAKIKCALTSVQSRIEGQCHEILMRAHMLRVTRKMNHTIKKDGKRGKVDS